MLSFQPLEKLEEEFISGANNNKLFNINVLFSLPDNKPLATFPKSMTFRLS